MPEEPLRLPVTVPVTLRNFNYKQDCEHSAFTEGASEIKDEFTRYEGQSPSSMQHQSDTSKDRVETEMTYEMCEQSVFEERSAIKNKNYNQREPRVSEYSALNIFHFAPE